MSSESYTRGSVVPGRGPMGETLPFSPSNRQGTHALGKAGIVGSGPNSTTSQLLVASVFSSAKLWECKTLCDTALSPLSLHGLLQTHHHPHCASQALRWLRALSCVQHLGLKGLYLEGRPAAQPWECPVAIGRHPVVYLPGDHL